MAARYYDDVIAAKLMNWMPADSNLRILKPDETKRLFETKAADSNDKPLQLPCIALSRNKDIELLLNIKNPKSFNGLVVEQTQANTAMMNVIPIGLQYQMDIYAKTFVEAEEYLRQYLFKIINNPSIKIEIPYNEGKRDFTIDHIANIKVLNTVSDTSDISEHLFAGQFTRWTIQFELQDAFLFSIPYKKNWRLYVDDSTLVDPSYMGALELHTNVTDEIPEESEPIALTMQKGPLK